VADERTGCICDQSISELLGAGPSVKCVQQRDGVGTAYNELQRHCSRLIGRTEKQDHDHDEQRRRCSARLDGTPYELPYEPVTPDRASSASASRMGGVVAARLRSSDRRLDLPKGVDERRCQKDICASRRDLPGPARSMVSCRMRNVNAMLTGKKDPSEWRRTIEGSER
jgi:hypothetical protein